MRQIGKRFGTVQALDGVDLRVERGTVHAILGENGAGKTTLMNILYGLYERDHGTVLVDGKEVVFKTPRDAIRAGIGMVHQHFKLVEPYTVLQNIVLGYETARFGFLRYQTARKEIEALIRAYNFQIDLDAKVSDITVGMQQKVEIIKTLYRGANILIFDEPTAVLTPQEINELMSSIRAMTDEGKTVIIITHKLKEIMQCADRCTVLKKGRFVTDVAVADCDAKELASLMVGREVQFELGDRTPPGRQPLFEIRDLVVEDTRGVRKLDGLSLEVHRGEIVGLAGVDGNGQKELFEAIASLVHVKSGVISINSAELQNTDVLTMLNNGIGVIPEDRQKDGLILDFSVAENLIAKKISDTPFSKHGMICHEAAKAYAGELITQFDIRPGNCTERCARTLSGGNQQKVIIAREIDKDPDLLIAIQPTRGMDVGAIEFVHKALMEQRNRGKGVLLISLELDEIRKLSDRIAVICNGRIMDVLDAQDADESTLGYLMVGGGQH